MDAIERIEYDQVQNVLIAFASFIRGINLVEFIAAIDRAEMLGPVLNPSLYRLANSEMRNVRRLAEVALEFQNEVKRQLEGVNPLPLRFYCIVCKGFRVGPARADADKGGWWCAYHTDEEVEQSRTAPPC